MGRLNIQGLMFHLIIVAVIAIIVMIHIHNSHTDNNTLYNDHELQTTISHNKISHSKIQKQIFSFHNPTTEQKYLNSYSFLLQLKTSRMLYVHKYSVYVNRNAIKTLNYSVGAYNGFLVQISFAISVGIVSLFYFFFSYFFQLKN